MVLDAIRTTQYQRQILQVIKKKTIFNPFNTKDFFSIYPEELYFFDVQKISNLQY